MSEYIPGRKVGMTDEEREWLRRIIGGAIATSANANEALAKIDKATKPKPKLKVVK